jgi:hypothetical protein
MNRAKFLQPTRSYYEGSYDGVWVVQYESEFYRIEISGDHFACYLLFGKTFEEPKIKNMEVIVGIQAIIATECFKIAEEREIWHQARQMQLKQERENKIHTRYEFVKQLTPKMFTHIQERCKQTGITFDQSVDEWIETNKKGLTY